MIHLSNRKASHGLPSANNTGGFRRLTAANDDEKEMKQQVIPTLRLEAGVWGIF